MIGLPNPWDGKPLGKEIKRGTRTRRPPEAREARDILLGDMRWLRARLRGDEDFSLASALEWREALQKAPETDTFAAASRWEISSFLGDKLQRAEAAGTLPPAKLQRFARVAHGKGFPLTAAHERYVEDRREGNPQGLAP